MKSLHFCTPKMLANIKLCMNSKNSTFSTYRPGWIPQLFKNDLVKINERTDHDEYLCTAVVVAVIPIQFQHLDLDDELIYEEILRYNKKFHPEQYFFRIVFNIKKEVEG